MPKAAADRVGVSRESRSNILVPCRRCHYSLDDESWDNHHNGGESGRIYCRNRLYSSASANPSSASCRVLCERFPRPSSIRSNFPFSLALWPARQTATTLAYCHCSIVPKRFARHVKKSLGSPLASDVSEPECTFKAVDEYRSSAFSLRISC